MEKKLYHIYLLLGQNEIHSDLRSWPCVRVHVGVNFSLNIFFSESTTPRELIFGRNVPWVILFKICSYGSEILNNFRTGSGKTAKNSLIFKNLLLQNHKCQNWTKSSFIISKRSFLKFVRGNFLWLIFFRLCYRECEGMKNHNFNAQ
jgi:hypothetical protein